MKSRRRVNSTVMRYFLMKRIIPSIAFPCSFVFAAAQVVAQIQGCPPICDPSRQFDEYGRIPWAEERARLDNAAIQFQQDPSDFVLYLIAYGARDGCAGEAQARYARAKRYLVGKRHLAANRIVPIDGGYRAGLVLQIWMWPRAFGAPHSEPTVDRSNLRLKNCSGNHPSR